jgi:biotin operon repressor
MMKQLRKEGFEIDRYRVRNLMKKPGLVVKKKNGSFWRPTGLLQQPKA